MKKKKKRSPTTLPGQIFDPDKLTTRQLINYEARVFERLSQVNPAVAKKWAEQTANVIASQILEEERESKAKEVLKKITKHK